MVIVHIIQENLLEGNEDFTFKGVLDADTATRVEILPPNPQVTIIDDDCESVHTPGHVVCTSRCTYNRPCGVYQWMYIHQAMWGTSRYKI